MKAEYKVKLEEEDNEIDETPMYNNVLLDDDDYDEDHD